MLTFSKVFKKWKAKVENETNQKLNCLRSKNGGEYDEANVKAYCVE